MVLGSMSTPQATPPESQSAEQLVQALGQFRAALPPGAALSPLERTRRDIYDRLWSLGSAALPALCRGLDDPDVQVRRNVALFLGMAAGNWYDPGRPRLPIGECMPALVKALADQDSRVKALAAQAVGATGGAGAAAVPALIELLGAPEEGERNSACIGLGDLGPTAYAALPALRKALSDPSLDVRRFAQRAIGKIEQ